MKPQPDNILFCSTFKLFWFTLINMIGSPTVFVYFQIIRVQPKPQWLSESWPKNELTYASDLSWTTINVERKNNNTVKTSKTFRGRAIIFLLKLKFWFHCEHRLTYCPRVSWERNFMGSCETARKILSFVPLASDDKSIDRMRLIDWRFLRSLVHHERWSQGSYGK